jgi:hypothetical protein
LLILAIFRLTFEKTYEKVLGQKAFLMRDDCENLLELVEQIQDFESTLEENLKKLIAEKFATQIKDGSLAVSYLNWEESANEALVEKFEIYSSSLILVKYIDGKEEAKDLTEFAFSYARKQPDFFRNSMQDSIYLLGQDRFGMNFNK